MFQFSGLNHTWIYELEFTFRKDGQQNLSHTWYNELTEKIPSILAMKLMYDSFIYHICNLVIHAGVLNGIVY